MNCETIVLIDAYSQIFRSFYALRHLSDSKGRPTNAVHIFIRLLLGLEKTAPGRYGAMLFDCGKVEFRLKLNADYKANRPPMPEDLKAQMPVLRAAAAAFGWPQLQAEGYEADDLIGGFCRAYPDYQVRIVTSDKDLSQLVDERVRLLSPAKTGGFEERGAGEVQAKFGVSPELLADYLALVGDSADNIAGVRGIGPKGAAELLNTCGAIESWLNASDKLCNSKYAAKLAGQEELLRRNLQLVRLRTDLPSDFAPPKPPPPRHAPDWDKIAEICREYDLHKLLRELPVPAVLEHAEPTGDEPDLFSFAVAPMPTAVAEPEKQSDATMIQGELF